MTHDVRFEQVGAKPLAVVRRRAAQNELPRVVPEACGTVWNALRAGNVWGAGRHVAVYLDGAIHLEVGVELDTPFAGIGEVVASATPAGTVAATTHLGPYQGLHAAHAAVHQWCAQNGHVPAGPSWEVYGHWTEECNADPSKIRTDVYYLLKPAGAPGDGAAAG